MKLIVGLGNPGKEYAGTRHNIGFMVIDALADALGVSLKKQAADFSESARAVSLGQRVLLAKPYTYMNLSGVAVKAMMVRHAIDAADLLVVCDDLDLAPYRLRIRPRGSSGGHKGLASIIAHAGTQEFSRLRIGIGRPAHQDAAEYVLSRFAAAEKKAVADAVAHAAACGTMWLHQGITESMQHFNTKE